MMLLSRVAENICWAGRYLERAEATARLIVSHTELYVDLPLSADLGWTPLLAVTGTREEFGARHDLVTEDDVIGFLAADSTHSASVPAAIRSARENLRRTRDQFPREAYEVVNDLFHWMSDDVGSAVPRRSRVAHLRHVISRCQLLNGVLDDAMSHDTAHAFFEIGRFTERADMTTRVLDVQAEILLRQHDENAPYADVTWMAALDSLNARQAFRRSRRVGVAGPEAIAFLLADAQFPRSVEHCLMRVSRSLLELPNEEQAMKACAAVQDRLVDLDAPALDAADLHELVDQLQEGIARLHDAVSATYFEVATPASDDTLVLAG
jgi:uncharacterized alpha-E superfamily protein